MRSRTLLLIPADWNGESDDVLRMFRTRRIEQKDFRKNIAIALACSSLLSACGLEGLPSVSDVDGPSLGAATPETAKDYFTGELLSDGSLRLNWPRDPSAVSYLIMRDGKVIANLSPLNLSAVVKTNDNSAAVSSYTIVSVNASNTQTIWVSEPTITTEVSAVETPMVTIQPEPIPVIVVPTTPVVEPETPVVEVPPMETVNLAPNITDTSFKCDPVIESVAFTVGQTDHFTLSVTDESPLTLTYNFDSSREGVVSVAVDADGVFTLSALQAGDTYLWLTATDDMGLVDEYELRVVVQ